ncbi:MAG: MerR family transcriptional regulator [Clostridiales bacterium]|nr:MerR family transcriptional regulator [Clostridiales bacterium]
MLKIGDFSKLSRVSIRMLRHYDEIGLLHPVKTDPDSGYRYYGEDQLLTAGRITALKDMGFGLSAIGELLGCYEHRDTLERCLLSKREELLALSCQTARRLRLLDTALDRIRKDDETMQYDVTLKTFPARYAATVRMHIPSYEMEGQLWGVLVRETAPLNLVPDDPCYCSVVFHDKEYREEDVDVEAQKTVRGRYPDTAHVRFKTLPEVTVASAVCKGSYDQLNAVMAATANWVTANGYEFDGPAFNIYHVSPHETSDPDRFVTEVCYPVKKR